MAELKKVTNLYKRDMYHERLGRICDSPGCKARVMNKLEFVGNQTPGLDTLYLCPRHTGEVLEAYCFYNSTTNTWVTTHA